MVAQQEHRFNDQFREAFERPVEMVKEYPLASMLLMFGMGLGVGVLVSQSVCSAIAELAEEPTMTEKVRKQVIEALSHVVSPATLRQIQSYTS
jgi:hypothetical protein